MEGRTLLAVWSLQQELLGTDVPLNRDELGLSAAIDGDLAVVGARNDGNVNSTLGNGAAYIYQRTGSTWNLVQKLTAPDGAAADEFGFSVAVNSNFIVVGSLLDDIPAPGAATNAGSAYVFRRTGPTSWIFDAKLEPIADTAFGEFGSSRAGDQFGISVAIDGTTIAVGARGDDRAGASGIGSVYIYDRTGTAWPLTTKLFASDGLAIDQFGTAVDVQGTTLVVGADNDDHGTINDAGSAYVFEMTGAGWVEQTKLTASVDQQSAAAFGTSVAVSGGTIVVGAPFEDKVTAPTCSTQCNVGAAYVFTGSGASWSQQAKLIAADADRQSNDVLGHDVDIDGDVVIAGAIGDDQSSSDGGAGYIFLRSGAAWTLDDKIVAPDFTVAALDVRADNFGFAVGVDDGFVLLGALGHNHGGVADSGAGYIFVNPNDPPVHTVPGPQSAVEEGSLTFSTAGGNAIAVSDVDAFGAAVETTLSTTDGTLTLATTAGLAFTAGDGTDDATVTITGTILAINAALDGLVFTPTPDFFGPATLAVHTNDLGNTGTGGPQTDDDIVTINVAGVNDAPSFTPGADVTVNEDAPAYANGWATAISVGPANESSQTPSFAVSNDNAALFASQPAIDAAGNLTFTPAANANGSALVTVILSDDGGTANGGDDTADAVTFTITINPVNDAPAASGQTVAVAEDGAVSITLVGADLETAAANVTFTITSLPTKGVLTHNGDAVVVGGSYTGPPTLVYTAGSGCDCTAMPDGFAFTVTDRGDPDNNPGSPALTSAPATVTINVTPAVADGAVTLTDGVLRIGGTTGNDTITATPSGANVVVNLNGTLYTFAAASVSRVHVWGRTGNDVISLASLAVDSLIRGGAGDDDLSGGSARDIIFGDAGSDTLSGGGGNDFLIGGDGGDRIVGAAGHDILVAGDIGCYFTEEMLRDISDQWALHRIADEGANDGTLDESVVDDDLDRLTGASGADWFIISGGDRVTDFHPNGSQGDRVTYV